MIIYVEKPKDMTKELLELIKKFSKIVGYKINKQSLWCFIMAAEQMITAANKARSKSSLNLQLVEEPTMSCPFSRGESD